MISKNALRIVWIVALSLALGFAAGWAGNEFATQVNPGLVNALDSVGENLFGEAVFSSLVHPPDPNRGTDEAVRLDFAEDAQIPILLNVFHPPGPSEPCRSFLQVEISPLGVRLFGDPDVFPEGSELVFESLAGHPPGPNRCVADALPGDQ